MLKSKKINHILLMMLITASLFYLWGMLFFYVEGISYSRLTPLTIPHLLINANRFDTVTNLVLFSPVILILFLSVLALVTQLTKSPYLSIYGNAHFASYFEIKRAGFFNQQENSIIVGQYNRRQKLYYTLSNHTMVFAPSRSGKGVSLVIPNALNWQQSLLVTDNKYEVFEYTSGYRKALGHEVYRFSPAATDFKTHRLNPLDYVSKDNLSKAITDLHLILDILIKSSEGENQMWAEEARSIALGILLWLRQSDRPFTLGELASIVKGGEGLVEFLEEIIASSVVTDNLIAIPHASYLAIQNFLQKAPKEQSGVRSTITSMLRLWEDPLICAATECSDIDFRDLRKKPITLYLSFGTNQITRLAPLINLVIQLFLNVMLEHIPSDKEPYKVLCLLDELNRFGRMDKLKDGFGDLAGYGVHLLPIIQNVGQFYSTYKTRDASDIFFQNTDLKIAFRQNTNTDKELVSKELGTKTVRLQTRSYSTNKSGSNVSESFIERPLLTPREVGKFPLNQQIILTGDLSIKINKICYYKDSEFTKKLLKAVDIPKVTPVYPIINIKTAKRTDVAPKLNLGESTITNKESRQILSNLADVFEKNDEC